MSQAESQDTCRPKRRAAQNVGDYRKFNESGKLGDTFETIKEAFSPIAVSEFPMAIDVDERLSGDESLA